MSKICGKVFESCHFERNVQTEFGGIKVDGEFLVDALSIITHKIALIEDANKRFCRICRADIPDLYKYEFLTDLLHDEVRHGLIELIDLLKQMQDAELFEGTIEEDM